MYDESHIIAEQRFVVRDDDSRFTVRIFHYSYARHNLYELYRYNELVSFGKCPRAYTTEDIMAYHVKGTAEREDAASFED